MVFLHGIEFSNCWNPQMESHPFVLDIGMDERMKPKIMIVSMAKISKV